MKKQVAVVGAVIVRDGLILCAQRGPQGTLAGLWEFPGGKIEPGETARQALEREIREELRCTVEVGDEVVTVAHEYDFAVVDLTTLWCTLIDGAPQLTEHADVRWLPSSELDSLEWAPADIPTVKQIMNDFAA
ncbi:(deoxy)nucleoside triphosphate pyrophosphohydrolase [Myceligenerans crystallogenes]|uniref:8-oxo-dGTP diphosphatase n=1 Tax=Myceligenerans crystallogenes TaxID=316335 RepID=A0ABN2NID8_9MICO